MSARKLRPELGAEITGAMSRRDQAAALGVSLAELCRWIALSDLPSGEFERRLDEHHSRGARASAASILSMGEPVPARGRVERALALLKNMTDAERRRFMSAIRREHDL